MTRDEIRNRVIGILQNEILQRTLPGIPENEPLGEGGLGVDSMNFLKYLTELEKGLGVKIEDDYWDYKEMQTIGKIVDYFCEHLPEGKQP